CAVWDDSLGGYIF
nr:immunoglobulin light chain junction region [Macaca mulatta]